MSEEGRTRVGRAEWTKRVERWRDSGLSAGEFGAEIGVNPRTLTYWKWRLGQEGQPKPARLERKAAAPTVTPFVEVQSTPSSGGYELALGNGRRLQIPAGFDADTLTRLLAVLERA